MWGAEIVFCFVFLTHFAPGCPSPPSFSLSCNPRLPGSILLAVAPHQHPGLCKQEWDSHETCSLVSAIVRYFQHCPLFEVRWSLRDAVNFQSCKMDTRQMYKNKQQALLLAMVSELHPLKIGSGAYPGHPKPTNSRSFIFGDSNCKFCSQLPHRHPKT